MGTIDTIGGDLCGDAAVAVHRRNGIAVHVGEAAGAMFARLLAAMEKRRSRRALLELSDRQLRDIGVTRADAFIEACRPLWR